MRSPTEAEPALSRRDFFKWVGLGSLLATLGGFFVGGIRFLFPNVLYEPPMVFKVGKPEDFPLGQPTFLEKRRLFITHAADGFYAMSSVCSHLGCNVRKGWEGFECPCHGSRFSGDGTVLTGPAPRPLEWYQMKVSHTGDLVVDKGVLVDRSFRLKVAV